MQGLRPGPVPQHFLQLEQIGGQLSASLLHSHDTETRATMTMALADDIIAAGQDASCHILRFSLQAPEAKSGSDSQNGERPALPGVTAPALGAMGQGGGSLWGVLGMGERCGVSCLLWTPGLSPPGSGELCQGSVLSAPPQVVGRRGRGGGRAPAQRGRATRRARRAR